jgi:hypothetical protein
VAPGLAFLGILVHVVLAGYYLTLSMGDQSICPPALPLLYLRTPFPQAARLARSYFTIMLTDAAWSSQTN